MDASGVPVVPDGSLLDHVAEFAYEPTEQLQTLFQLDEEGYFDAVANLVQTISVGGSIGCSKRKRAATHVADQLKEALSDCGRLTPVDYFDDRRREERLAAAKAELTRNWQRICDELDDLNSEASVAFFGHVRREFHYFWLKKDPQWIGDWYSRPEDSLRLPPKVAQHILKAVLGLAKRYNVAEPDAMFKRWIEECATSHYRIFYEYWLHLSDETGCEYMPALTRSSLRFPRQDSNAAVKELVMPFVALKAMENVKERRDLVHHVADWTEGPGRTIVEGMQEQQSIVRSTRDPEQQLRILKKIEDVLNKEWPREVMIALDLVRLGVAGVLHHQADLDAAKDALSLSRSTSYRWLWSIRSPELKARWRDRVRELAGLPR